MLVTAAGSLGFIDIVIILLPAHVAIKNCISSTLPAMPSNTMSSGHPSFLTASVIVTGFLSPASRGALLTAMLVSYLLLAVAAGLASVWLWGMVNRSYDGWQAVAWRVAAYFPGITLLIMSVLNVLIVNTGSSGAIPLGAFFSLIALWFLISIPLCFSGAPRRPLAPSADCCQQPHACTWQYQTEIGLMLESCWVASECHAQYPHSGRLRGSHNLLNMLPFPAGGVIATRKEILAYPTRTNQIPRHIPPPHWASHPWVLFLAAGLLPFGTIFVELYFAMSSIWQVELTYFPLFELSSQGLLMSTYVPRLRRGTSTTSLDSALWWEP